MTASERIRVRNHFDFSSPPGIPPKFTTKVMGLGKMPD